MVLYDVVYFCMVFMVLHGVIWRYIVLSTYSVLQCCMVLYGVALHCVVWCRIVVYGAV